MNVLEELRSRFTAALNKLNVPLEAWIGQIRAAQDAKFGDYQANFVMPLAKRLGRPPRDLAAEIVAALEIADLCDPPEIAGPGFINLRLRTDWLRTQLTAVSRDQRCGVAVVSRPQTIVVDYSGPNVAKPMHVGHIRSTVIGAALHHVNTFLGHKTIGDNHIGDWGTQFGMIIYGYKNFLDAAAFQQNPVEELARLYRLVNQISAYHAALTGLPTAESAASAATAKLQALEATRTPTDKAAAEARKKELRVLNTAIAEHQAEIADFRAKIAAVAENPAALKQATAHPGIAAEARQETAKLHAGDAENVRLWNEFLPHCLAALDAVYERLGIRFDVTLGESFYNPMLAEVVEELRAKGIAVESESAVCVFVPGHEAPFIVRKADGAFTYATTDLATIRYRVDTLKADRVLYVVDARQSDHFKQLFDTARRWGYTSTELQHTSFGSILGEDRRPFKTRSGDTVGLESLIDESIQRARGIVSANFTPETSPAAAADASGSTAATGSKPDDSLQQRVAEAVGIGAIKYADLCQNRDSDYVFSWDKMLATTGDTAAYMQYAFARVSGIFRRGNIDRETLRNSGVEITLDSPTERALALQLLRLSETLHVVSLESRPNYLTAYLFDTANAFSSFFEKCPVLKAETPELQSSRLLLADLTARVIETGLKLLGITAVEQM